MSTSNVLRLDAYRDRRTHRLRLAEALYGTNPGRKAILGHLSDAAAITGADRAAIVWVDEYGPGLVHPHVVLDLLVDRPRRSFALDMLSRAWELGVPGALDEPAGAHGDRSAVAIALGSDGTRAWFLVAESITARARLDAETRSRLLFIAGECCAIVLHRDLDEPETARAEIGPAGKRFAGWQVLQDMEGRDSNASESARINRRFVIARLVRMLVDDDLTLAEDRVAEQVVRAREELLAGDGGPEAEHRLYEVALDAFQELRFDDLSRALIDLGAEAEADGHHNGALELYRCAFAIAAGLAYPELAVDAARASGRVLRRQAEWVEAREWYDAARSIAERVGYVVGRVRAMVGSAVIDRDRGNLPAARTGLLEALSIAEASGLPDAIAPVCQDLMAIEQVADNAESALRYGWRAAKNYTDDDARVTCLASLGGVLLHAGELRAAEDAWMVVAYRARHDYYRVYAWDALAHISALRGDSQSFERFTARCDEIDWLEAHPTAAAEILHYRGLSYAALGRLEEARDWLTRAMAFSEEREFARTLFEAEAALAKLDAQTVPEPIAASAEEAFEAPYEVSVGLQQMRAELVGAPA